MAKWDGRPRKAEQRRKYTFSQSRLKAEALDAESWWPAMSAAILEDARRCERIRQAAEDDLMDDLRDWQRKARKAKRDAKPKHSTAALLAMEAKGEAVLPKPTKPSRAAQLAMEQRRAAQ
ncbi:hypothetical protein [Hyphomonas sp. ND6WE1B]|uniref:hypothetical protein n=1 Tax=Hyphomonas sp. ND6WE1B TaxID=1848191 RepID=UPI0008075C1D|nr:hypothetical protein [Hyphomonas sp. ND6WE1B]